MLALSLAVLLPPAAFSAPALRLHSAPIACRTPGVLMQEAAAKDDAATEAATAAAPPVATPPPAPVAAPSVAKAMSEALPFLERPASLDDVLLAGDVGFDPLGFSQVKYGPFNTAAEHMGYIREAEIKHGRVCMLALVGWISTDLGLRAPGVPVELKAASLTSFAAHDVAVADGRLLMLLILCGVFEIAGAAGIKATLEGKREPGDFALTGFMTKTCEDPKKLAALKQAEIKHCRLAMMAFGGVVTQAGVWDLAGKSVGFPYWG